MKSLIMAELMATASAVSAGQHGPLVCSRDLGEVPVPQGLADGTEVTGQWSTNKSGRVIIVVTHGDKSTTWAQNVIGSWMDSCQAYSGEQSGTFVISRRAGAWKISIEVAK